MLYAWIASATGATPRRSTWGERCLPVGPQWLRGGRHSPPATGVDGESQTNMACRAVRLACRAPDTERRQKLRQKGFEA